MARRTVETETVRRRRRAKGSAPQFYVAPVGAVPADPDAQLGVPELLHEHPLAWGDLSGSIELTRYAFEGGDCAGVFDALVEALPLAETTFVPASFASQLYLDDLMKSAFGLRGLSDGSLAVNPRVLRHVLCHPPKAAADRDVRQAVLRELRDAPPLAAALRGYYEAIRRLRAALEVEAAEEPSLVRRKIEVLVAFISATNALERLAPARSALARLFAFGQRVRARKAWERLLQLVDLEGNIALVDLQLKLGADGTVRGFHVVKVHDRDQEGLMPGPVTRFFQQFVAFFRGHRYGESEVVVRLLDEVFSPLAEDVVAMVATTGAVEVYLSALSFAERAAEVGLEVCLPALKEPSAAATRTITGLFNPLLFLQSGKVMPCDVPVPRGDALTVITGPNSGGKTRLLQALALAQLFGQVGIFVPASSAELIVAPSLFLSLVVENDAGQVEGRLGTELTRIRKLFEELEPGSMAILDELCSGTNPEEGEEIFTTVLSLLPRLRPQLFVSTHFLGLASRLERERPVEELAFLQVELDETERPTFRFVPGVATTSLAHKVAERLGVTAKDLEALVEKKLAQAASRR